MLRLGVDIGGTFTDFIFFNEETGKIEVTKTPSTPRNPADGVLQGMEDADIEVSDVGFFSHGSTVGTNALIERTLPRTGLVTSDGFRDVLEIRDGTKEDIWDTYEDVAPPYVERRDRLTVEEATDYGGDVITEVNEEEARSVVRTLKNRGIETIAIAFINAYANGSNEKKMKRIVQEEYPEAFVCCSHEILPEMGEHERTSTTVINAALVPVVREYLQDLSSRLQTNGYDGDVLAMHSGGGVMTSEAISYYASRIANSGPTAGAIAGGHIAGQCGFENSIGLDIGGTSADVSLTYDGEVETVEEWSVEYGHPIMFPTTDVKTIGAGGGSIAWIDDGESLRVGPKSMGADPGPACYQRGGDKPTLTDANVLLGWLDPGMFLGGDMDAVREPSRRVIQRDIGDPLAMDPVEAANAVERIAIANMCNAVRLLSTNKGYDPRDFVLVAFGGAGPIHAPLVARQMDIPKVIIPPYPGINSALGCLLVDVEHDVSQTYITAASSDIDGELEPKFQEIEAEIRSRLRQDEGISKEQMELDRRIKMRYTGQWRTLEVPYPAEASETDEAIESFHEEHERTYAYSAPDEPVEIYGLRVIGKGIVDKPTFPTIEKSSVEEARKGTRDVYFGVDDDTESQYYTTNVYSRQKLGAHSRVSGPAVLEAMDSTVLVPPQSSAEVDELGNVIIEIKR